MDDLISRRAVIDLLAEMQGRCTSKSALVQNSKIWKQIKDFPSAQPKKGKWILGYEKLYDGKLMDYPESVTCSVCGDYDWCGKENIERAQTNFCPNCGADMKEEE